jgi:adenine-specific DNA-methyltransferase
LKRILQDSAIIFATPKPTRLIKRILQIATDENDTILDSFAGSGTTGQAVLEINQEDKGNRKFILVEMEKDIAQKVTAERVKRVAKGYSVAKASGKIENIEGLGSGFRYCKLSNPLFDKFGNVHENVKFKELARHIFFSETGQPLPAHAKFNTPLIGVHNGVAYYLLFNGILGDKSVSGGNVLTSKILSSLPEHAGNKIIFGESCRLSTSRLGAEKIVFKQIPYEIKTS